VCVCVRERACARKRLNVSQTLQPLKQLVSSTRLTTGIPTHATDPLLAITLTCACTDLAEDGTEHCASGGVDSDEFLQFILQHQVPSYTDIQRAHTTNHQACPHERQYVIPAISDQGNCILVQLPASTSGIAIQGGGGKAREKVKEGRQENWTGREMDIPTAKAYATTAKRKPNVTTSANEAMIVCPERALMHTLDREKECQRQCKQRLRE
jgi:hypothetical protein